MVVGVLVVTAVITIVIAVEVNNDYEQAKENMEKS
jgi:hypothetical protein